MSLPYAVALTHELLPTLVWLSSVVSAVLGTRDVKSGVRTQSRGFAILAIGLFIVGFGLWYGFGPGRQESALADWLGVVIPTNVADYADDVGGRVESASLIIFNVVVTVGIWRRGQRNVAIFLGVLGFIQALLVLNSIYNELFLR